MDLGQELDFINMSRVSEMKADTIHTHTEHIVGNQPVT